MKKKNKKTQKIVVFSIIAILLIGVVAFFIFNGSVECNPEEDKCDGSVYYICQGEKFVSQGEIPGKCEVVEEQWKETFYRFEDNKCFAISIYPDDKTVSDYLTLAECQSHVIPIGSVTIRLQEANTENLGDMYSYDPVTGENVMLVKFDLSTIPSGRNIDKATLHLYMYFIGGPGSLDNDLNIYRLTNQIWDDSISDNVWNTRTDVDSTQTLSNSIGWDSFDVTSKVQTEYKAGNYISIGLEDPDYVVGDNPSNNGERSHSRIGRYYYSQGPYQEYYTKEYIADTSLRPYLEITYK